MFSITLVISMMGCASSPIEKGAVSIEDSQEEGIVILSEESLESNVNSEQTAITQQEEVELKKEGEVEETEGKVETYQSTLGYQIEYFKDSFTVKNENGVDSFTVENHNPDLYPYVYLNISRNQFPLEKASSDQKEVQDEEGNIIGYLESDKEVEQLDTLEIGNLRKAMVRNFYL